MKIHKTAVVTGASSGFGKLYVEQLLEKPEWRVVAAVRGGESRARKIYSAEFLERVGPRLMFWDLHLDRQLNVDTISQEWQQSFGTGIDVLVNNAGYGILGPALDQSVDELRAQFEVNFFSPAALTHALLRFFPEVGGRVLNVSSICGLTTFPFYAAYCSTKYALEAYTEGLRYDLEPRGIQFCLIEPGAFKTEFNQRVRSEVEAMVRRSETGSVSGSEESSSHRSGRFNFDSDRAAFDRFIIEKKDIAGDPNRVSRLLVKLSIQKNIPVRVTVGADAAALAFFKKLLPSAVWTAVIRFAFSRIFKRN